MILLRRLLLLFLATGAYSSVLEITDDTLSSHLVTNSSWILLLYADWCGACKRFHPHFEALASEQNGTSLNFAKINIVTNTFASARFFIQYIPTVILYENKNDEIRMYTLKSSDSKTLHDMLNHPETHAEAWSSFWISFGTVYGYLHHYFLLIFGITLCVLAALVWWSSQGPDDFEYEDRTIPPRTKKDN